MSALRYTGIVLATVLSLGIGVQEAAAQTELQGGGPSLWDVDNIGGTSNGLPAGGTCDDSPGLNIDDAELTTPPQSDAYDNGHLVFVNDQIFIAPAALPAGPATEVSAGPVVLSGLNVTVSYRASQVTATVRTVVTLQNPSAAAIAANVDWVTNVGSDDATVVDATSSGDTTFAAADRWVITSDGVNGDPVITHVLFGPGTPAETPTSVSETVFDCSGTEGIQARFAVSIPAGGTRHLVFFNQLNVDVTAATAAAAAFNSNPPFNNELLTGISTEALPFILNWDFFGAECRAAQKSQLSISAKNRSAKWKWSKGAATAKADFGNPTATTNYAFCIIDEEAAADCTTVPFGATWKDQNKGFDHKQKEAPVSSIKLKEGEDGKSQVAANGTTDLTLPLQQSPAVRAVLANDSGVCWASDFTTAGKNDEKKFSAK